MNWRKFMLGEKATATIPGLDDEIVIKPPATTSKGDEHVLAKLAESGADLSQPREVLHYFYFPTQEDAAIAAAELRRDGFQADNPLLIGPPSLNRNPWRVLAAANVIVSLSSAQETTRRFRKLAAQHGGEYDGWEAAAHP